MYVNALQGYVYAMLWQGHARNMEKIEDSYMCRRVDTPDDGNCLFWSFVRALEKEKLINKGANVLVAGSTVFKSKDPIKTISALKFK